MVPALKELHLERKNGEQFIHIPLDILDAVLLPSPYFGRDIIIHGDLRMGMNKLGDIQVESRVIHQNKYIRLPGRNIFFAPLHIGKNSTQMQQDGNETHIRQFLIMIHRRSAHSRHQVAAKEAELGLRVFHLQSAHQVRRMQVTGSFADNQIILHKYRKSIYTL